MLVTAITAGVAVAGAVAVFLSSAEKFDIPAPAASDQLPDEAVIACSLVDAGVSPEALAIAGLTGQEAASVISAAVDAAETRLIPLRAAMENKASTKQTHTQMRRGGQATAFQLTAAREAADLAAQTHASLIAQVRSPAVSLLDTDELRRLNAYHANEGRGLPMKYRAGTWDPAVASDILQAAQQKAANESRGESVEQDAAAILSQADLNSDVAVAAASLDARLTAIRAEWDSAISGQE